MRLAVAVERETQSIIQIIQWGGQALILTLPLWIDPWAALPFEPAKVALLRWGVVALTLTALLGLGIFPEVWRRFGENLRRAGPVLGAVLLYLGSLGLSTLVSESPRQSLWGLGNGHGLATLASMIVLWALLIASQPAPQRLIETLLWGSVPICLYALIQAAGWDPLRWRIDSVSVVHSTLGRSNFLGAYLAILLPLALYRWVSAPPSSRRAWRWLLLLGLYLFILLLTLSRAAWLAAAVGTLTFLWLLPSPREMPTTCQRFRLLALAGVCIAFVAVVLLGEELGRSQWLKPVDAPIAATSDSATPGYAVYAEIREESLSRRLIIWRATLPIIGERPLLGHGPEMFVTVFNERYPPGSLYAGRDVIVDDPHNQLLELLIAAGLVGMLAWLALLGTLAWQIRRGWQRAQGRQRRWLAACLAALVAFLVQAQFNPDMVAVSVLFWVLAATIPFNADR